MAVKDFIFISELIKPAMILFIVGSFFSANAQNRVELLFENGKAVAVKLSSKEDPCTPDPRECYVVLEGKETAIFGSWSMYQQTSVFSPVISFSAGMAYQIFRKNERVASFQIPLEKYAESLKLSVFPSTDTVPANLLKMYFQFSEPMKQLRSERFVFLLDERGDTLREVFQSLHPELWNKQGDRLTLWIDPGRVKRDLIRNQKLGAPFEIGKKYKLIVSNRWQSLSGNALYTSFEKSVYVEPNDRKKINPKEWLVEVPAAQSTDPLKIHFGESLDWVVAKENVWVNNESGEEVRAEISTFDQEAALLMAPASPWHAGLYHIHIDPKVADLAGNNLNRLFDEDLKTQSIKSLRELEFVVR